MLTLEINLFFMRTHVEAENRVSGGLGQVQQDCYTSFSKVGGAV